MKTVGGILIILGALFFPQVSGAAEVPAVYTNENIWTSAHDVPVQFDRDENGNFWGFTATGKYFTQVNIENSAAVRLQRFSIDEAFYYVSDKGIILAPTDIVALSIYLSLEV